MATTTNRALRYPLATAAPNIPQDIQNLATDVDNALAVGGALTCTSATRPSSPANGLFIWESDTGHTLRFNSSVGGWRYVGNRVVSPSATARNALSVYAGLECVQSDTGYVWVHDGTVWRFIRNLTGDQPYIMITRSGGAEYGWGNISGGVYGYALSGNTDTSMFTWTSGTSPSVPGTVTVLQEGLYRVVGEVDTDCASAYYASLQLGKSGVTSGRALSFDASQSGNFNAGFANLLVGDTWWLPANATVSLVLFSNNTGTAVRDQYLTVQRVG